IHTLKTGGEFRPRKEPGDADKVVPKIRATVKPELVPEAIRAIVRGENELRLRALIRATRVLAESKDPKDKKQGTDLSNFLSSVWGVSKAYEAVAEGEAELHDKLKAEWGDVQLPPPDATVNSWVADELLIKAAVRRLK
ncbi:MAG TPA: hypothetical protein VNG33_02425, partial [Polyangiaceae bacterium]|nr:hypothetical protein [Polyangiaceae bacterium]